MSDHNLRPDHQSLLDASAIKPPVAEARGYRSITVKRELLALGFTDRQARVPALLLPVWGVDGQIGSYQIRPDLPRLDGKRQRPVKYETPTASRMLLDVHPLCRPHLGDPLRPLLFTEGIRKGDAAVSQGLCCLALLGVWNWRGQNDLGGSTVLADFESIALKGRQVYLVFDSDVMQNPGVYHALARLKAFLESRGAEVFVCYLPPGDGGTKVGLDDYLAAGHSKADLLALATPELRRPPHDEDEDSGPYRATTAGIIWRKTGRDGAVDVALSNFSAQITGDVLRDDGSGTSTRTYEILASRRGREVRHTVPAVQFPALHWPMEALGAGAVVSAGMGNRDRLREAIQVLSGDPPERRVFTHTGWRQIDGAPTYLHSGGGIGAEGTRSDLETDLPGGLAQYRLPEPPEGEALQDAIRRSLAFLDVAPRHQTWPLLAAAYAAPLAPVLSLDYGVWVCGGTGAQKSTVAALALSHYGAFDRTHLPANFTSTGNSLELLAYLAKDALLVVDDYAPCPDQKSAAAQDQAAHRLLRAVGDTRGRNRMRADGSLVGERAPRCLVLATAELAPPGSQSTAARALAVEWARGSVNLSALTQAQRQDAPSYPLALAGYVRWLAQRLDALRESLPERLHTVRREFARGGCTHDRVAETAAKLSLAAAAFLSFARDAGAIPAEQAEALLAEARRSVLHNALATSRQQAQRKPSVLFLDYLQQMFAQGSAYLADRSTEGEPADARRWGWKEREHAAGGTYFAPAPNAAQVGWVDAEAVYLLPDAAHREVTRFAAGANERFPTTAKGLARHLDTDGFLLRRSKDRVEVKTRIGERTLWAWKVRLDAFTAEDPEGDGPDDPDGIGTREDRAQPSPAGTETGNIGNSSPASPVAAGSSLFPVLAANREHTGNAAAADREPDSRPLAPVPGSRTAVPDPFPVRTEDRERREPNSGAGSRPLVPGVPGSCDPQEQQTAAPCALCDAPLPPGRKLLCAACSDSRQASGTMTTGNNGHARADAPRHGEAVPA